MQISLGSCSSLSRGHSERELNASIKTRSRLALRSVKAIARLAAVIMQRALAATSRHNVTEMEALLLNQMAPARLSPRARSRQSQK